MIDGMRGAGSDIQCSPCPSSNTLDGADLSSLMLEEFLMLHLAYA